MASLLQYLLVSAQLTVALGITVPRSLNTTAVTRTLPIALPSTAPAGRQIINADFQGYSIEFSYMLDYAGNLSYLPTLPLSFLLLITVRNPNALSYKLLQNLYDVSGAHPIIRAGGTTQNRALYKANQTTALIEKFSASSPDQPSSLTIGPAWLESFQTFPQGTKYIYGLNFYDGAIGLQETLDEAIPAWAVLGDSIYAFEIGNEVDGIFQPFLGVKDIGRGANVK